MKCDCIERIGIEINSNKQFEELKEYFDNQLKTQVFNEIKVIEPYFIGHSELTGDMKWFANKWYLCNSCGCLWEFVYPDFPAKGFVRKFEDGKYYRKE
jgi:hypothetical protein